MDRQDVYKLIDGEREYQQSLVKEQNWQEPKSVGAYLTLLRVYLAKAEYEWSRESDYGTPDQRPSLSQIRKIAGIAVSCMEEHGAPARGVPVKESFPTWK